MTPFSTVAVKDLQTLQNVSYTTARRHYKLIREAIGFEKVMVFQLAKHWNSSVEELLHAMRPHLKK